MRDVENSEYLWYKVINNLEVQQKQNGRGMEPYYEWSFKLVWRACPLSFTDWDPGKDEDTERQYMEYSLL